PVPIGPRATVGLDRDPDRARDARRVLRRARLPVALLRALPSDPPDLLLRLAAGLPHVAGGGLAPAPPHAPATSGGGGRRARPHHRDRRDRGRAVSLVDRRV